MVVVICTVVVSASDNIEGMFSRLAIAYSALRPANEGPHSHRKPVFNALQNLEFPPYRLDL